MSGLFLPPCFCRNKSLPVWLMFAKWGRAGFLKVWFRNNKTPFRKRFISLTSFVVRTTVTAHFSVNLRKMSVLAPSQLASPVQGSVLHMIKRGRRVRKKLRNYKTLKYFVSGWHDFQRHKFCVLLGSSISVCLCILWFNHISNILLF